jgi:hypothetical protein
MLGRPLILYMTVMKTTIRYVLGQYNQYERREQTIYYLSKILNDRALVWSAKRLVLLVEYDIIYMTRKAIKGSAIVDHLANNYVKDYEPLNFYLPDEEVLAVKNDARMDDWWTMYFDGVVNVLGNGDRAVKISLEKK